MFSKKSRCCDMNNMMWQGNMGKDYLVNMPVDPSFDLNKDCVVDKSDMKAAKAMNCCDAMPMPARPMGCCDNMQMPGCKMQPVIECPVEKCVHRTICHEIPHVCPVNTRIINHHVYKHTYAPSYSCCEENQVSHMNEGSCGCFR